MGAQARAGLPHAPVSGRERAVWSVLALTTLVFLLSCGSLTYWIIGTLGNITTPQVAKLEDRGSSPLSVYRNHILAPESVADETTLNEGDEVQTSQNGAAFITLFDGSTVQQYFDTRLRVERLRTGSLFQNQKEASIVVDSGTVLIVTADLGGFAQATYLLATSVGVVEVETKSKVRLRIDGSGPGLRASAFVDYGTARLLAHGKQLQLGPGTMATISEAEGISGPGPIEEELLRNGNFTEGPTSGAELAENGGLGTAAWLPLRGPGGQVVTDPGVTEIVSETVGATGILTATRITRDGAGSSYALVGIRQEMNQPVEFHNQIDLLVTAKIVRQTLPAGGPQGNLYPLTIKLIYTDSEQQSREWLHSFYYLGPESATANTTKVAQGTWKRLEFVLKAPGGPGSDMTVINAIEVYGFGREFQSWVTDLSIIAR